MRRLVGLVCYAVFSTSAFAQSHYVKGYVRKDGTYVAPHMQTNPDNSLLNNWSTKGNVNPYTGKPGTVDPYAYHPPKTSTYGYISNSPSGQSDPSGDDQDPN